MPAELAVIGGGIAMAYAQSGGVPWHGAGEAVPDGVTTPEMARAARLDWNVILTPAGALVGGLWREIQDRRAIVRATDGRPLGIASEDYSPIQNAAAMELIDPLVQDGLVTWETAGALYDGRRVWAMARTPGDFSVGGDRHHSYLLLSWSHDGSGALRIAPTDVRVVCANTLRLAETDLTRGLHVRHTGDVRARLTAARELLRNADAARRRYQEWADRAAVTPIPSGAYATFEASLFGYDPTSPEDKRPRGVAAFRIILGQERERAGRATVLTLVNGVTGYADHSMNTRGGAQGRWNSTQWGAAAQFKARGIVLARSMVRELAA